MDEVEVELRLLAALFMLLLYIGMFYRNCRITTKIKIDDIRIKAKFFPKYYSMPPRWIRKHFKLKKSYIPKFLLFRLYLAVSFLFLALLNATICLIIKPNYIVIQIMTFVPLFFYCIDLIVFFIVCHIFEKR